MADRQRVVHGGVIAAHRIEIRAEQECRSALHRHPHLRARIRLRKWLAVGALHAGAGPRRVGPVAARGPSWRAHFIPPMFAAVIFAAVDQEPRTGAERIVWLPNPRDAAIAIVL